MKSKVKNAILIKNTALAFSLLWTVAAQADVAEATQTKPAVLFQYSAPAPYSGLRSGNPAGSADLTHPAWASAAATPTTLRLTAGGLPPLATGFAAIATAPELAAESGDGPLDRRAGSLAAARDTITTASIPAAAAPAGAAVSQSAGVKLRQSLSHEQPLFGAHRIRFGKIASGARISGLIRKAAGTGTSAICINRCAELADSLAIDGDDITAQLRRVSATVNGMIAYRTDQENHGRLDQWSTPNETLGRASGDCEDYAILKMAVLARLGVPVTAMEIVVVKDTSRRLFHAILSVALEDRTLILDNMTDAVEADTRKPSYAPLFSLSGNANYIFGYKGGRNNLTASLKNIAAIAPGAGF